MASNTVLVKMDEFLGSWPNNGCTFKKREDENILDRGYRGVIRLFGDLIRGFCRVTKKYWQRHLGATIKMEHLTVN